MLRLILSILLLSSVTQANISAKRPKSQDYKEIITQNLLQADSKSAMNSAVLFENLDHSSVVAWPSQELMQRRFEQIRDERFLKVEDDDFFMRRISWLYPDDGCFARAAKFIERADLENYRKPERIFIFGNLNVSTENHPDGEVSWWYHTAPIVRIDDQVYVLDPAIDPAAPLKVEDWILKQVPALEEAELAYCSPHTYAPFTQCLEAPETADDSADYQQRTYLRLEWNRQETMNRDPEQVLGGQPPWSLPIDEPLQR